MNQESGLGVEYLEEENPERLFALPYDTIREGLKLVMEQTMRLRITGEEYSRNRRSDHRLQSYGLS